MANKTIPDLPTGSALTDADLFEASQGGTSIKVPSSAIKTYVGGSTVSLTADTDIAAGTTVSINSSGHAVQTWGPSPIFSSLQKLFDIIANQYWGLLPLGGGNYVAFLGGFGVPPNGAVPVSISGSSISVGTFLSNTDFQGITSSSTNFTSGGLSIGGSVALSSSLFVVIYGDYAGTGAVTLQAGSISGGVITLGGKQAVGTDLMGSLGTLAKLSATSFAAAYDDNGTDYGVVVGTLSGTTITLGTAVKTGTSNGNVPVVLALSATKILVLYSDGGNSNSLTAVIGTVSGTTVTLGTPVALASSDGFTASQFMAAAVLDATHWAVGWRTNSTTNIVAGSVSGTTPTWGTNVSLSGLGGLSGAAGGVPFFDVLDATHLVVALSNGTPSLVFYSIAGTTLSAGNTVTQNYGSLTFPRPAIGSGFDGLASYKQGFSNLVALNSTNVMFDDGLASIFEANSSGALSGDIPHPGTKEYQLAPNSATQVLAVFFDIPTQSIKVRLVNWNAINGGPVGFAASAITNGQNGSVTLAGAVSGFSGLTPGTYYYANGDGTLTANNTGKGAGYALSATQIAIAPPPQ